MKQSLSQSIRTHWRRALSMLLVLLTVLGMIPTTAFAAESVPVYAATGAFDVNIAGTTGWNGTDLPLPVYDLETDGVEIAAVSVPDNAAPIAFAVLADNGGDRVQIGLAYDDSGSLTSWEGGPVTKTGWADKKYIMVNLPDILPSVVYSHFAADQYSDRLGRYEYIVPCLYPEAEQIAAAQKDAMSNGETLMICGADGNMADVIRVKGDAGELHSYTLGGTAYQRYEAWSDQSHSTVMEPFSIAVSGHTINRVYSTAPSGAVTGVYPQSSAPQSPANAVFASPTGGAGGLNPGSPGGQKPSRNDVAWTTDQERTFIRFTLIEFPEGVVTDLNTIDSGTWHQVGRSLNVVWGNGSIENWDADACRSNITWFNSNAMQYNGRGSDAEKVIADTAYAYDATSGNNQRWVTTADEFQAETGITDQQKEQMFHCNSSSWSTGWVDGDYTSMWGTEPESVTPGNPYKVYKANDAFIYLLGRLTETGGAGSGWSKDEAIDKWSEYVYDADGNLRTKYRIIVETGGVFVDPDGIRRAYTLREAMAYSLYNNEASDPNNFIWDQSSTIRNMSRWMRQSKDNQFLEYPLDGSGIPTGEELHSTNGFTEADSFIDTLTSPTRIRNTIFSERRSYGLHIFSPFNFEHDEPDRITLEVTKSADAALDTGDGWGFTVTYTAGTPTSFTATKNGADCKSDVVETGSGLSFKLKAGETIHFEFNADSTFRCEVKEDDTTNLTNITGTGGDADMTAKKFTTTGANAKTTFTNGTTTSEKKPVYLKLKKIAAEDKKPLAGAVFSVYADSSCSGTPLATMTTGADGNAAASVPNIVEDGESITLYVKETTAPAGCTPLDTPFTVTAKAPENSTEAGAVQVGPTAGIENGTTVTDEPDGPVLYKRDAMTNQGVGPATFKFSSVTNGDYEFTTDENGELEPIQWWDPSGAKGRYIKPGEYAVTEIIPPPNYMPTTEVQQIKLELDEDGNGIQAGPLVFQNLAKVGLRIVKYDRNSHQTMAGVSFEIFRDGVSIGIYETNGAGEIVLTNIEPGTYRAVEVDTGDEGHILDGSYQEIELTAGGGVKDLIFFNDKKPGMKLIKVDSADPSKVISGAVFEIRAVNGSYGPEEFTTDGNGEIDLSMLPEGSYVVTEKSCPGYVIDEAQRVIHLHPNDTAEFVYTNTKKPSFRLIKTSSDGTPLDGVTFRIAQIEDGTRYLDRTTQNGGEIFVEDMEPGIWSVQEIATVEGYVLDTGEYHVELVPGKTSEIRLENKKEPFLTISKVEKGTNTPIPGTVFTIEGINSDYRHDVTTGADGTVTLQVAPGSYRVTEKSVPEPYCLPEDEADRTQTVSLNPDDNKTLIFKNSKKPLLTISKIDADTGEPVPGTVFTVKGIDNDYQDDWTTGADGKVAQRVDPGTYQVTEKSVPAPYYLPDKDADRVQTISLNPGDEKTLLFRNHKMPELTIYKEDSVAGAPIEGAKFHVTYTSNGEASDAPASLDYGYFLTDSKGEIRLHESGKKLYPGEYTVTEVEPAPGFQMKEPTTQKVILHGGESKTLTFQNEPLNAIIVEKYDSVTHAALPGCTFQLRFLGGTSGTGGTVIGQKVTGQNGTCIWTGLTAGTYIVEEIDPADGYSIINSSETVYISDNGTQSVVTVKFDNAPDGILLIRKVCSVNPSVTLANAEFKVMYADGTLIGDSNGIYRTDENGEIRIEGLKPGKSVIVTETKAPDGFIIDTQSQTIQIKEGRTVSLTFKNQPKGKIIIQKRDSVTGDPLPGAQFRVTTAAGCEVGLDGVLGTAALTQNGIFTTDSNGEIRITNLAPGAYVLTEIKAPAGYVMDAPSTNVVIGSNGDTQTVIITNTPKGGLIVEKYDSVTREPLSGATFKITMANGELVPDNEGLTSSNGLYTTDRNGQIVLSKLLPGTYIVAEETAPDNYRKDPTPQTVVVNAADTQTLRFYDDPLCTLTILKRDAVTKKPLAKAEFLVRDSSGRAIGPNNGRYITGSDGTVTVTGLTPNSTIVVSETKAPNGYVLDETPQTIIVRTGVANGLIFDNEPGTTLIIRKFIEGTENEPLSGVAFKVIDGSGADVGPDGGVYYTDHAGEIVLSGIEPGTTVIAREIKTVDGFVLDGTPQTILIKGGEVQSLTFWNKRDCSLTILKQSTSKEPLTGAVFYVTDEDGAAIGTNNGRYTTDRNGLITITGLQPGQVIIVTEEKAPDGYVKDPTPKTIKIKQDVANSLIFENAHAGSLVINKRSSVDKQTPLEGVMFKITTTSGEFLPDENGKISSDGLYYTDENGQIILNSVVGTLVVTELESIDGYTISDANRTRTIEVKPDDTQTIYIYNDPLCSLTIRKVDSVTGKPVPNTEFTVKDANGNLIGKYTTGSDGTVTVTGLVPGTAVVVTETRVPSGYVLNTTPQTIVVKNGTGNTLTSGSGNSWSGSSGGNDLTFENDPTTTLIIRKFINGTANEPLAGVAFKVVDGSGAAVGPDDGVYYTDNAGEIVLDDLEPGMTVTAREIKTVDGFVLDGTPQDIQIKAGEKQQLTFWNKRAGTLVIQKKDKLTNKPLAGVEFLVTDANGSYVPDENGHISSNGLYHTDSNGEIRINGVVGTLVVTETKTVDGYTIDETTRTQTVVVNPEDVQTLVFYNTPKTSLIIEKYVEGTTEPMKGVTFLVTNSSGEFVGKSNGEYVTDENGRIEITDLTPGETITAKEIRTLEGYILDSQPKSVKITEGEAHTLRFYNQKTGYIVIRKLDKTNKAPIAGAEFELTYATGEYVDDAFGHLSSKGRYTTNDAGEIRIPVVGTIVAKEVTPAPGYVIDTTTQIQTVTVNSADTQTLVFYNEPLCSLTLTKRDSVTGKPVPGTEFTLKDGNGNIIGKYTTGSDGTVTVTGLIPGSTVIAVETKVPAGYVLDSTPQTIIVKNGTGNSIVSGGTNTGGTGVTPGNGNGNNLDFENDPTTTLIIRKFVDGTASEPLAGVTFKVVDGRGQPVGPNDGVYVTNNAGEIVINDLEPGTTVTARETKTVDGFVLDGTPQDITIKAGGRQELTFWNKRAGTLVIQKKDKLTGKPLAGVEFELTYAEGGYVDDANGHLSSKGLYTTDANGEIRISGITGTIVVKETKCLPGYTIDPGTQTQTVTVNAADTQTLTFYNTPGTTLTIQKYVDGTTTPIQGVTFLVTDSAGTPLGSSQGEYVTDRNGRIVLNDLTPGTTIIAKEVRAADGYVLDGQPQSILIKEGDAQQLTFYNKANGGVEIIKVDASDKTKRLANVTFEIRRMDDALVDTVTTGADGRVQIDLDAGDYYALEIEAAEGYKLDNTPNYFTVVDGKPTSITITNKAFSGILLHKIDSTTGKGIYGVTFLLYDSTNKPIGQYTTDNTGYIYIDDLTVSGKYFLKELENKGYIVDTELKTVYVTAGETTLVEWKNTPITGQIQIIKKSADYNSTNGLPEGTLLEGAVFEIYDKANNLVDTIKSDNRGLAASRPLPLDRYTIREVKAPANYGINDTVLTAYLEHEGQIVTFEVTDKSLATGVSITKTGPKEVMGGQPVRYMFSSIANTSNVRLDNFYWRDTLPAEVRLDTVVTGTYNRPGNYKIVYRVNGGEYQTLADNLSTSKNYTLAASAVALGLAADERVTEIMFVFGQAPAGFAQVEKPYLYCTARSGLPAGAFVNKADVGGTYNGEWIQAVSRWVTNIYAKTTPLPRTGY